MSIKNIGAALLLFSFCSVPSWAQALIIPQVVDGDVWQTTIVVTNTTVAAAHVTLSFFVDFSGNATQPWNLPFLEVGSTQSIALPPGATILLHTPGTARALSQGWGQVVADSGVVAYAVFTKRPPGFPAQVGTAPAMASASRILMPFDNTSGNVAAMALVNTSAAPETIAVAFRSTGGTIMQSTLANIPPQGHVAFTLPQQFAATAGQSGLAEFYTTSGTFSILALSFNPAGSFTTAPVYVQSGPPIIGTSGPPGVGTLPQFNGITILSSQLDTLGIAEIVVGSPATDGSYSFGFVAGVNTSGTGTYSATWNSVTVSGQTLTFNGLKVSASTMSANGNVADITSASLTITLTPQVVATSGTVSGSMTLVSTVGTISGSFTGTYVAQ